MSSRAQDIFRLRLRSAREDRGWSQTELAKLSGVKPNTISQFEAGIRKPSFESLLLLANKLDVTTDYLLGRTEDFRTPAQTRTADRLYDSLSESDRKFVDQMIERLAHKTKK